MKVSFRKSEKDVLLGIREGNSRIMEEVYARHRTEFLNWAIGKFGISQDDALEHYQDTLTIFFEKVIRREILEIESSIKTFLFGIGKNRIRQQFDKESRREKHTEGLSEHFRFLAQHEDAAEVFEVARKTASQLFESIGDLCKEILRLFYYEKKTMQEIASSMGHKSEGVSRTTKKRCLEKLREQVKTIANG